MRVPSAGGEDEEITLDFIAGHRIGDRYIIEAPIGKGGMGVVYRAQDVLMKERVALKFLHPYILQSQRGMQLFVQEAQIARRLRHENIVAVHDVSSTPEGIMYLSMEFLHGQSLRAFLRGCREQRRLLDVRLAVTYAAQMLAALDYAHRTVVHRDIKPENVMILTGERVKVLDFGLAKVVDEEAPPPDGEKKAPRVIGTEAYAAPEQMRHLDIDLRADLYAVGLILRELLTLRTPIDEQFEIHQVRNDVAPSIIEIVNKAIQTPKEDRWQSAAEFRLRLMAAFDGSYRQAALAQVQSDAAREVSTDGMVLLEGGSFIMGNSALPEEGPEFEYFVDPFYVDIYPVTNRKFAEFLKDTGRPNPKFWGMPQNSGPEQPVVGVTWEEASAYAAWAGKKLPTEAQWEFTARGRENRKYPWGNTEPDANKANYGDHLNMASLVSMHDDGRTPNGVCDLAGNVYEWTGDFYLPYNPAKRRAAAQYGPPLRTVRGGSWHSPMTELRCAFRKGLFPETQSNTIGFRCVVPVKRQ
ncbi:MAG: bifunctional serine/threonine-protein kinase/formylglycine-generating enzyme family protein [Candidatus Hydrogenedentes bacterium]|nr:bifunctional serine/threonine-protein kinase/formylglycine-generating enzyme family protein [Candidatus Hydrogenedentota bacterium]